MRGSLPAATLLLAAALAGCSGDGGGRATGTLAIGFVDDAPGPLEIVPGAAYAQETGNGSWEAFADPEGVRWPFAGTGEARLLEGEVPAGSYGRFRLLLREVAVDGRPAALARTGVELPLPFDVPDGGRVQILLNLSWEDAVYDSAEGTTFDPVLAALEITGPGGTARLRADEVGGDGQAPVARMRVFDAKGLQAFASDFVADDAPQRVVGNAGRLAFSGGDSEAVAEGAAIASHAWDFGDGTTATGITVFHDYPIAGGNFTARLTVTDSLGATDTQAVPLALKPGLGNATFRFASTATGLGAAGTPAACGPAVAHEFAVDNATAPDGSRARLLRATAILAPNGTAHALANLDLALVDGADATLASGASPTVEESFTAEFDPKAQPAAGTWTLQVAPCAAFEVAYNAAAEVVWEAIGDPKFAAWVASYDDGHGHQH